MVWLFVLPVLDVPAKVRLVAIGSGIISPDKFVKLWTKSSTLGDDMLDKSGDSLQDETLFSMFLARHAQDESITSQHPLSEATFAESN